MKHWIATFVLVAAVALAGCGGGIKPTKLDTSVLDDAFPGDAAVAAAAQSLNAGDFAGGLNALADVAAAKTLDEPQIDAMYEAMKQVQSIMSEDPKKSVDEAWSATRKLGGALERQLSSG